MCSDGETCPPDSECRDGRCVPADAPVLPGRFRRRVELNYEGTEAVSDFPVVITFDGQIMSYADAGAEGSTLRFTDLDGNLLAHEIERWDENGTSIVWIKVPQLLPVTQDDALYMYWGGADPPIAMPATAVWNSDFVAVWHLDDDPASGADLAILDSTANRHHGTASDSMTSVSLETGAIGDGLYFDAADDAVIIGDKPEFELPLYTYTFHIRGDEAPNTTTGNGQPIFNADEQFNFSWNHVNGASTQAAAHRSGTEFAFSQIDTALEGDTWYSIAVAYDGVAICIYLDGAQRASTPHPTPNTRAGDLALGNDPAAVRFAGALDEVRISSVARPPAWINASFANLQDGFVTFSAREEF